MSFLECECGATFRSHVKIGPKSVKTTKCPECGRLIASDPIPTDRPPEPRVPRDTAESVEVSSVATQTPASSDGPEAVKVVNHSAANSVELTDLNDSPAAVSRWRRLSTAYGSSLTIHVIVAVILAAVVIPTVFKPWQEEIVVELNWREFTEMNDQFDDERREVSADLAPGNDLNSMDSKLTDAERTGMILPIAGGSGLSGPDANLNVATVDIQTKWDGATAKDSRPNSKSKTGSKRAPVSKFLRTAMQDGKGFNNPLLKSAKDGLVAASSPGAASKGVFSQLAGEGGSGSRGSGNQWHIWLLDSSISLQAEREKLGDEVAEFYRSLTTREMAGHLDVSVVAFGQRTQSVIDKTRVLKAEAGKLIGSRIKDLPVDESGIENVMTAVAESIDLAPKNYSGKISIVIWTDESGDDIEHLEETIAKCSKTNTTVHIVGPRSVFGMQPGLQRHTLPPPLSWELILPVTRGPDSAFPERVRLPLWYDSTDMPWSAGIPISSAMDAQSLGGPLRCGLLAPTGPYALTRLALATGGNYTILERHGDVAPPNADGLLKYAPDYRGAREMAAGIDDQPLRRAVIESAALTWTQDFWPPQREFPMARYEHYPFRPHNIYMTPFQFAQVMSQRLQQDRTRLAEAAIALERAIDILEAVPSAAVAKERDAPRWKAWYTLNRGLLLAHSVRIREFLLVTEPLMNQETQMELVNNQFNHLLITESEQLLSQGAGVRRATMARSLLEQVIHEHPNTPWSQLAEWELQHQLGFNIVYRQIPIPQNVVVPPPAPHPTLPRL